jgi:hypothetical protein
MFNRVYERLFLGLRRAAALPPWITYGLKGVRPCSVSGVSTGGSGGASPGSSAAADQLQIDQM